MEKLHFIYDLSCIVYLLFLFALYVRIVIKGCRNISGTPTTSGSLLKIVENLRNWLGRFRKTRSCWRRSELQRYSFQAFAVVNIFNIIEYQIKYLINLEINATIRDLIR